MADGGGGGSFRTLDGKRLGTARAVRKFTTRRCQTSAFTADRALTRLDFPDVETA
jgi:hypothetical protein